MTAVAVEENPYELALAFVNNVRVRMGQKALAKLTHASEIGHRVIRHMGNGPLYVFLYEQRDKDLLQVLVELGCRTQNRYRSVHSDPNSEYTIEAHLPRYLYEYAGPKA